MSIVDIDTKTDSASQALQLSSAAKPSVCQWIPTGTGAFDLQGVDICLEFGIARTAYEMPLG